MFGFSTGTVMATIGPVLLGVVGWIVTHFVAGPVLEFYKIRRSVHEEMFFTANMIPGFIPNDKLIHAAASIRRLAARLDALQVSLLAAPRGFLSSRGYDLAGASAGLTGLSNSIGKPDASSDLHRHKVQKSLKLPCTYTDEEITQLRKTIGRRT